MTERAKILMVDDRPENLVALEAVLGGLDQTLVRAGSGEEALKALLLADFAVILLDVQMPGMDGFETAAQIKRRDRTKDVPIIFLTAVTGGPHHAYRGYAAGAVDYLTKPFDPWILRAKVAVFVELHHKNQLLKEQSVLLSQQLTDRDGTGGGALAAELSARLAAVEEQARLLEAAVREAGGGQVAGSALLGPVQGLETRLTRLRSAVDALG
ncbi:MAG TPA: response regulator [Actinocrinis sp.]|nr:response regulator [Actinocrinis sp.]